MTAAGFSQPASIGGAATGFASFDALSADDPVSAFFASPLARVVGPPPLEAVPVSDESPVLQPLSQSVAAAMAAVAKTCHPEHRSGRLGMRDYPSIGQ